MEKGWSFQQMVLKQEDSHIQKLAIKHRPYTLHKILLKMFYTLNCKIQDYKIIENNLGKKQSDLGFDNDF